MMKRRVISLLAMVAMLCTMVVFAMPEIAVAAETYPRYKDHVAATAAGHDGKNWSISSKEDWDAMRDVADVATEDYFKGVTFHLTNDIEFGVDSANRRQPMGINTNGAAFAGTIDGHGYGFNNIYIFNSEKNTYGDLSSSGAAVIHTGLFLRLGNCTFRDFGLNGGLIRQSSSNNAGAISSFGTVMTGKVPTFERVWSSVNISSVCSARINGLAGTIGNYAVTVNVNGFVFDGVLAKGYSDNHKNQDSYAVLHTGEHNDPGTFLNIITDFKGYNANIAAGSTTNTYTIATGEAGAQFALFRFNSESAFDAATIENIYGVKRREDGIDAGYSIGTVMNSSAGSNALLTDMSAAEAAYTINTHPTENPVYFKLNEKGQVRPIPEGKSEGKIIKIAVAGDVTKNVYVNSNSTVDLKTELGYKSELTFEKVAGDCTINGTSVTVGTGDVTVAMTNSCVDHDVDYAFDADTKQHSGTCELCGHQVLEDCELIDCTSNPIDWNAATHNGTCEKCESKFAEICAFEYEETADGYKYVCECGRTADAEAPVVAGDINDNSAVDLVDAIQLLKKAVGKTVTINERNADVDGNNVVGVNDVYKIILYFMKDAEVMAEFEATQARANVANFYNKEAIEVGNLKMDGKEDTNNRYVRTEYISVGKGNKVVFGPIRKAQAVMGHFYDADGNAIELINVNNENLKTEYSFKATVQEKKFQGTLQEKVVDGMVMVSITAPADAAYVRLQANAKEADQFYIRINNEFSLEDYQCRTTGDTDALNNPEKDQLFLTIGDSLCSASRDTDTLPYRGWEGRIRRNFGAATVDSSEGGSAVSTVSLSGEINPDLLTGETATDRQWIVSQLLEHKGSFKFEYILLEGGGNDAHYDAPMGEISDSFDPETFADISTFAGGMELLIYNAIKEHGDTAAIGYMSIYAMPLHEQFKDSGDYFVVAEQICEKWNIPYLDIFNLMPDFDTEKYTINSSGSGPDYIHANADGYDMMQEHIDPFISEMRPIDQDIYLEVQKY